MVEREKPPNTVDEAIDLAMGRLTAAEQAAEQGEHRDSIILAYDAFRTVCGEAAVPEQTAQEVFDRCYRITRENWMGLPKADRSSLSRRTRVIEMVTSTRTH